MRKKVLLALLILILSAASLSIGAKDFSWVQLISGSPSEKELIIISRLPRLISIIITGAGLSISGLIMQTITGNKFVSPSVAGTMDWSKIGILIAILFAGGQSSLLKLSLAFTVSLGGTFLFVHLLRRLKIKDQMMVPLVGMMLGTVVNSVATFLAYRFDISQNMSSWLQGNFSLVIKGRYELLYLGIPCVIAAYLYASKFTIAGMGEEAATNLGINHNAVVIAGLFIVSLMSSAIIVTVGSIAFVGLIVPNIVSMYKGDNLRNSLFETAVIGGIFLLCCDLLSRIIIFPYEIPISVISGVLGAAVFLFIIIIKRRSQLGSFKKAR